MSVIPDEVGKDAHKNVPSGPKIGTHHTCENSVGCAYEFKFCKYRIENRYIPDTILTKVSPEGVSRGTMRRVGDAPIFGPGRPSLPREHNRPPRSTQCKCRRILSSRVPPSRFLQKNHKNTLVKLLKILACSCHQMRKRKNVSSSENQARFCQCNFQGDCVLHYIMYEYCSVFPYRLVCLSEK